MARNVARREPEAAPAPRWRGVPPIRFIGVDLAWGERKHSAIVVLQLEENRVARPVAFTSELVDVEEIAGFIVEHAPGAALVGIDAPLVVPNATGARACDTACTSKWGKYDAGALPANKKQCGDPPRGWRLLSLLEQAAFEHRYDIQPGKAARAVLEVYPHPATVAFFRLDKIFKYKRNATAQNQKGLQAFQKRLVADLDQLDPPVELEGELGGRMLRNPTRLRGVEFERQSDLVDALMCSIIAFHFWRWGTERWEVLGGPQEGAILTPLPEAYGLPA